MRAALLSHRFARHMHGLSADWVFLQALSTVGFRRRGPKAFPAPLPFNIPLGDDGYPDIAACMNHSFFEYYFSFESEAAWHALYSQESIWELVGDHWVGAPTEGKKIDGRACHAADTETWWKPNQL